MANREVAAQAIHEGLAVLGANVSALLELDDMAPDLPIGFGQMMVYGLGRPGTSRRVALADAIDEVAITGIVEEVVVHTANPIRRRCSSTLAVNVSTSSTS